ncbi:hypothetical protein ASPWEDRAFT_51657 [Aspergillus wentii DTO 134E9]|uniref:CMP/dCMP-type deaminase domain-containing protein n=1 Tax=Aspergillus wentii DTO 134E9 TaxID=1073089 RepID=A0A1L9RLB6_ASPWE|nr:uncharacterized protein ASPWEDRAFT_51657 [Aspergillus wentii DTO 134E9]OJJ35673.1 hypothetical protein ASPWEDRAFT_51657 [Aspergillus wentii DTO 134E9]
MEVQDILGGLQPYSGQIIPIKTVQETQASEEFADAYVAEVNVKCASKVIKALDSAFPRDSSLSLNHLRRFGRRDQLPEPLLSTVLKGDPSPQTIFVLISPPVPDKEKLQALLAPFAPPPPENAQPEDPPTIRFHTIRVPLQPPMNNRQAERWSKTVWPVVFNPSAPRANIAPPPQILNRTQESIQRAGQYLALAQKVAEGAEQSGYGRGVGAVVVDPSIEATIDDGSGTQWAQAVVAVAGDARYSRREAGALSESELHLGTGPNPASKTYNADLEGGPELHALMRAVDMVARKRREEHELADPTITSTSSIDKPYINALETHFLSQSDTSSPFLLDPEDPSPVPEKFQKTSSTTAAPITKTADEDSEAPPRIRSRSQGGYLCSDLDVYLTHEPCVCCSMGLLLSRFRAVIFSRKGRLVTGGLASEPVISPTADDDEAEPEVYDEPEGTKDKSIDPRTNRKYYGLHWRKELNWRALGFEFVEESQPLDEEGIEGEKGVAFHA